ncbi:tetratricopeptide repeat protein [Nocardia xishanensis]|uniref:caspase, EACC1-associated type n=1 Tax=Nocardia xishanensis TaxID=238964 RepID=UPI0033D8C780
MTPAPSRSGWRAALIGVSRYVDPEFPDIPAALNNVADLARLLTASTGSALAERQCCVLTDPEHNTQVGKAVASAAQEADDVLLVYFAGHGVVDRRGRLYLALSGTSRDHPEWSSVPFATLRDELIASPARARILILDCCFSGRAFEAMGASSSLVDGQIDIQGTYTIASSARNEPSIAPEGHRHTAFTAALLSTATNTGLTLDQLYQKVDQTLHRDGYPRPQRRTVNIAGELRLFTPPPALRPLSGGDASIAPIIDQPTGSDTDADPLFESGRRFADQGDLTQAENSWRLAASQGHTGAMNNLANLLDAQGQAREAHEWYREAAERGNVDAMGNLGILLYQIKRVSDAEFWWRRAAEAGNTDAMYNLAITLDKSRHLDEALTWYWRAAEADHTDAMHNLAIRLRYRGQLSEATTWWQRAGHRRIQRTSEKLRGLVSRKQPR